MSRSWTSLVIPALWKSEADSFQYNSSFESRGLPAAETKKLKLYRTKDQILYLKKQKPQEIM